MAKVGVRFKYIQQNTFQYCMRIYKTKIGEETKKKKENVFLEKPVGLGSERENKPIKGDINVDFRS